MTHPSLDEVCAALTGVLGPVSRGGRTAQPHVLWLRDGWRAEAWESYDPDVVTVRLRAPVAGPWRWLVTRDGAPIDGESTVTLDALPALVAAAVAALGLGEAVTT